MKKNFKDVMAGAGSGLTLLSAEEISALESQQQQQQNTPTEPPSKSKTPTMKIEGFGFPCAVCGKPALELEFWPKGVEHPMADSKDPATIEVGLVARGLLRSGEVGTILVTSAGIGMVWSPNAERYAKLLEMARQHDVAGLAAAEFANVESYCPQCKEHYCGEHCRLSPMFDGDWVEGFETTCPQGHKKQFSST